MNKKRLIIIISILIIFILAILIFINFLNNTDEKIESNPYNIDESDIKIEQQKRKVISATDFYTVENCIKIYINAIKANDLNNIYNLLSEKYIENNNINMENINGYINKDISDIVAKEMYYIDNQTNKEFIVMVEDNINNRSYFIVNWDTVNTTFSVEPILNKNYNNIEEIEIENIITEISDKGNNKYVYIRYTEESMSYKYFNYYKDLLLNKPEDAYRLLNDEYKAKRFPTIEEFREYISLNKRNIQNSILVKYSYQIKNNMQQYTLLDNNENCYIINENSIMDFNILLDDYTILTEEYEKNYLKLNDSKKLSSNINMVMRMLSDKNYASIYDKLNEQFKANNFNTLSKFKEYIKIKTFDYNVFEATNVKQEGNVYICSGKIKSGNRVSASERNMTIIMQLKEGTDFEMSFNFN